MDKRLKKSTVIQQPVEEEEDAVQKQAILQDEVNVQIIRTDKIKSSQKFMESLIFNLVHRLEIIDEMNFRYNESLASVETYPPSLKYYIHIPCWLYHLKFL